MSDEVEAVAKALMKSRIDQANAERYIGGPHTSPMVEPEEYDIDDPPDGMEELARLDAEVAVAALDAVRSSGSVLVLSRGARIMYAIPVNPDGELRDNGSQPPPWTWRMLPGDRVQLMG